ncbi:3-oxoacyl-ACP synthase III family protein [Sphaerisporangium sp. NPDC051011]|uniref:3-oxoacyl-ACP synthase III family protein n=1 Tax=Sphaerisporangium sp. NPDC051011 TaxID=3155792 RepID=UPI0033EDC266
MTRANDFWTQKRPDPIPSGEGQGFVRLLASEEQKPTDDLYEAERRPYMRDAFRGSRERRVLAEGEGALDLEARALEKLLRARGAGLDSVDAVMVSSFLPDTFGPQNAAYLTHRLGMTVPAWNFESAQNGSIVGLQSAAALVRSGEYERVAVVVSYAVSRLVDPEDTMSWFLGDGAGAFLVERCPAGSGVLGAKVIGTQETCGAYEFPLEVEPDGHTARVRLRWGAPAPGAQMRDDAGDQMRTCVEGALRKSGHAIEDVDFFIFNTPVAWMASYFAKKLGADPDKTISTYPLYANIGSALTPVNLFHAAESGRVRPGDLVVLFGVGSISTAGALVMRWGDVALGPVPEPGTPAPLSDPMDDGKETSR